MSDVASNPRPPRRAALISGALGFAAAIGLLALLSSFASEPAAPEAADLAQPSQLAAPVAEQAAPKLPVQPAVPPAMLKLRERPLPSVNLRPALEAAPPATGGQP